MALTVTLLQTQLTLPHYALPLLLSPVTFGMVVPGLPVRVSRSDLLIESRPA